ncbi:MAG: S-layer homology domain-containing protein [Clostridiales bacterium]|nr:S-layer homology domain-containing protein [Clostridiales bacterium]
MKKTLISILAATMLITNTAFAADFTDTKGHWAEEAINTLAEKGIVNGVIDTEFNPDGEVTRAQYLKMIMEATGMKTAQYRAGECLEATADDWYAPYLQRALDCGLIPKEMIAGFKQKVEYEVDEDGKAISSRVVYSGAFNGVLPISREEMAVLTQYFYQYTRTVKTTEKNDVSGIKDFTDQLSISEWAENSVKLAVANGFIEGMENNIFSPKSSTTRAQAATVILRVIN